jgi:transketolase
VSGQPAMHQQCIDTPRLLTVDAVQKAQSVHPGTSVGAATMAYPRWDRSLKHNPRNPARPNRDRFVLSAGHASMLLRTLLRLTGSDLPLNEQQSFRQWGSKTPAHPEYDLAPGGILAEHFGLTADSVIAQVKRLSAG